MDRLGDGFEAALGMVERGLTAVASVLRANGMVHFDAHFHNVLTDGHRLYLADFGLASHTGFTLSAAEGAFLRTHRGYDRAYTVTYLTNWLVGAFRDVGWDERDALIREYAAGRRPTEVPAVAAIIHRYAPVAAVMNGFHRRLRKQSRTTPYPVADLACAWPVVGRR